MSIDLTDLNNWPDGAEAYVCSVFTKWVDGDEYSFERMGWYKEKCSSSLEKYKDHGYKITMRPQESDKLKEGEKRMENYVKKYKGHDVPEGATHVSDFPVPQPIEFYRVAGGEYQYFNTGFVNPSWRKSAFNEPNKWEIELPEEPKTEWVPVIGKGCEMLNDKGQWVVVHIFAEYDGFIHGWNKERVTPYYSNDLSEFRPLKSKTEQELDFLIDKCSDCELTRKLLSSFVEKLNEAGWTPPKEGKK